MQVNKQTNLELTNKQKEKKKKKKKKKKRAAIVHKFPKKFPKNKQTSSGLRHHHQFDLRFFFFSSPSFWK